MCVVLDACDDGSATVIRRQRPVFAADWSLHGANARRLPRVFTSARTMRAREGFGDTLLRMIAAARRRARAVLQ